MAWKLKYRCKACGYEAEVYEGRGLFRQQITAMSCPDCKTIQNIVVGGIIADVAPSYRSEVGTHYCVLDVNFRMLNSLSSSIRVQSNEELFILPNI
jgi:hypothetical protein